MKYLVILACPCWSAAGFLLALRGAARGCLGSPCGGALSFLLVPTDKVSMGAAEAVVGCSLTHGCIRYGEEEEEDGACLGMNRAPSSAPDCSVMCSLGGEESIG